MALTRWNGNDCIITYLWLAGSGKEHGNYHHGLYRGQGIGRLVGNDKVGIEEWRLF